MFWGQGKQKNWNQRFFWQLARLPKVLSTLHPTSLFIRALGEEPPPRGMLSSHTKTCFLHTFDVVLSYRNTWIPRGSSCWAGADGVVDMVFLARWVVSFLITKPTSFPLCLFPSFPLLPLLLILLKKQTGVAFLLSNINCRSLSLGLFYPQNRQGPFQQGSWKLPDCQDPR